MLKVAVVQMSSTNNLNANLEKMKRFVEEAASKSAQIVAFPEMAYLMGSRDHCDASLARYEDLLEVFAEWARQYGVYLAPGSLREPVRGTPGKYFNTLPVFSPKGAVLAKYRKIFLFKANLPDRVYQESDHCQAGNIIVTSEDAPAHLGFSICFDLRFPELFRALKREGVQLVLLPSAFTVPTGQAHWKPLLQARAIENQFFVVAPAQTGRLGDGRECHGHSMVVSPWGEVLGELAEGEGVLIQEIDLDLIRAAAARVDAWAGCRNDVFKL